AHGLPRAPLLLCAHVRVDDREPFALLEEALPGLASADHSLRAQVLCEMAMQLHYAWQPERRLALAEQGLREARQAGDPYVLSQGLFAQLTALCAPGPLAGGLRLSDD